MIVTDHIRIEDVKPVMVGNVVRDAHLLSLAHPMTPDDAADQLGMTNFGEYDLRYISGTEGAPQPNEQGRYLAVLTQLCDGDDDEENGTW